MRKKVTQVSRGYRIEIFEGVTSVAHMDLLRCSFLEFNGEGHFVSWIWVDPAYRCKGIRRKMYKVAKTLGCLASDSLRTEETERYWQKEMNKGRARGLLGQGRVSGPGPAHWPFRRYLAT